jgi:hypothetical protein
LLAALLPADRPVDAGAVAWLAGFDGAHAVDIAS